MTKVDRRFHAPWVATLIIIAAAEILLALYVFTTFFDKVSNYIVLFSIAFWMASFAAILLPYRRPEIYAAAPDYVQRRIGGVPVHHAARHRQPRSCSRWSSTRRSSCRRSAARPAAARCCS